MEGDLRARIGGLTELTEEDFFAKTGIYMQCTYSLGESSIA